MQSFIGINYNDGNPIEFVTLKRNSDLQKAGKLLTLYYNTTDKVEELLARGDEEELGECIFECKNNYHYEPITNPTAENVQGLFDRMIKENACLFYLWDVDEEEWMAYSNIILPETVDLLEGGENGVKVDSLLFKGEWEKNEERQKTLRQRYQVKSWEDFMKRCGGYVLCNAMGERYDTLEPVERDIPKEYQDEAEDKEIMQYFIIQDEDFAKNCTAVPLFYDNELDVYVVGKTWFGMGWDDESTCPTLI